MLAFTNPEMKQFLAEVKQKKRNVISMLFRG